MKEPPLRVRIDIAVGKHDEYLLWTRDVLQSLKIGGFWEIPSLNAVIQRIGESTLKVCIGQLEPQLEYYIKLAGFTFTK